MYLDKWIKYLDRKTTNIKWTVRKHVGIFWGTKKRGRKKISLLIRTNTKYWSECSRTAFCFFLFFVSFYGCRTVSIWFIKLPSLKSFLRQWRSNLTKQLASMCLFFLSQLIGISLLEYSTYRWNEMNQISITPFTPLTICPNTIKSLKKFLEKIEYLTLI
jgi:hypothetical protein